MGDTTRMDEPTATPVFDPAPLLLSEAACKGLAQLTVELRRAGYDNTPASGPLARAALGGQIPGSVLVETIGDEMVGVLTDAHFFEFQGAAARLACRLFFVCGRFVLLPREPPRHPAALYLEIDSIWLLKESLKVLPDRGTIAVLGCGPGLFSVVFASDARSVVSIDIDERAVRTTRLSLAANSLPLGFEVVSSWSSALRARSLSFMVGHPPWGIPSGPAFQGSRWLDGGKDGSERLREFVQAVNHGLANGGLALFQTVDAHHHDGQRPLAESIAVLEECDVDIRETAAAHTWPNFEDEYLRIAPSAMSARHVLVTIRRQGRGKS